MGWSKDRGVEMSDGACDKDAEVESSLACCAKDVVWLESRVSRASDLMGKIGIRYYSIITLLCIGAND